MAKPYRLISSDSHLEVLPERWVHRVPEKYRDRAPRHVHLPDGGDGLLVEGVPLVEANAADLRAGRPIDGWQPFGLKYEDTAGTGPPEQRVKEQERDGLDAEVLFPSQVAGPSLWRNIADDTVYKAIVRAYNDWLAEEYCSVAPDRLLGLGVIPWTNVDDAVAEMEHCVKLGLRGVLLGVLPNAKGYPTPEDDKFWAAAAEMQVPVTIHVRFYRTGPRASQPVFKYPNEAPEVMRRIRRTPVDWVAAFGLEAAMGVSQLIFSGAFDRFPNLKLFFAETRAGWLPFWFESADLHYERARPWAERLLGLKPLKRLPSEYIRDHLYWSIQYERTGVEQRHRIGVDKIMFATDFPHIECEWPNTASFIERLYADVPEDERHRMLAGNAIEFFHLEDTPLSQEVAGRSAASA